LNREQRIDAILVKMTVTPKTSCISWWHFDGTCTGNHAITARATGLTPGKCWWRPTHAWSVAGFQNLYEGGKIVEAACWAHARHKFHEIHVAHASPTTAEAIERIAVLYAIEAEIRKRVIFPSGTATRSVLELSVRLF
jgi:hypothetical protein